MAAAPLTRSWAMTVIPRLQVNVESGQLSDKRWKELPQQVREVKVPHMQVNRDHIDLRQQ